MKLDKITDCVNKAKSELPVWTPSFLAGFRANVYGGREYIYVKRRHNVKSWGGIEPFDYLTDQEKDDWYAGIAYGRKERKECRKL